MKESIQQMAASLDWSTKLIKDYCSKIEEMADAIKDATAGEITMKASDKIVEDISTCLKCVTTLGTIIKSAKRTAELVNDEVYEMPEALKRDEL
jgi:hypothetical protein